MDICGEQSFNSSINDSFIIHKKAKDSFNHKIETIKKTMKRRMLSEDSTEMNSLLPNISVKCYKDLQNKKSNKLRQNRSVDDIHKPNCNIKICYNLIKSNKSPVYRRIILKDFFNSNYYKAYLAKKSLENKFIKKTKSERYLFDDDLNPIKQHLLDVQKELNFIGKTDFFRVRNAQLKVIKKVNYKKSDYFISRRHIDNMKRKDGSKFINFINIFSK